MCLRVGQLLFRPSLPSEDSFLRFGLFFQLDIAPMRRVPVFMKREPALSLPR